MPVSELDRIDKQAKNPRALALWRALQSLKSCSSFMNTGAHPDDETSAMLAAVAFRDGLSVSYACANRGEGGQNDIGSHSSYDLGVIRTFEMERAADVLGLRLYWLSESPNDTIFDFGFSKSGTETLGRWGHERALQRFVHIIRSERPDIICTTFLDIPGQHGHHRAMTQLALEVFDAAADKNFKNVSLPIWQIKKLYLPAWSGAGNAYDDDLPPPPATVTIKGKGEESISGWTYEQIGQHSRRFHLTQGMGRWVSPGQERDFPLHLARTVITSNDDSILAGLPTTLSSLAEFGHAESIKTVLQAADAEILNATNAFPQLPNVRRAASKALHFVRQARAQCPHNAIDEIDHRLQRKERQLSTIIRLASRVKIRSWLESDVLHTGDSVQVRTETEYGDADTVDSTVKLPTGWERQEVSTQADGPDRSDQKKSELTVTGSTALMSNYPNCYLPDEPADPSVQVSVGVDGETSHSRIALETRPLLLPSHSARLSPSSVVLNTVDAPAEFQIDVVNQYPAGSDATLQVPKGWKAKSVGTGFTVSVPPDAAPGLHELALSLDNQAASTVNRFDFPHIEQSMRVHPATVQVLVLNVNIPSVRVGYVGGGNDRVAERLAELGFQVEILGDEQLANPDTLEQLDTLVIGLFAVRTRPILQQAMPSIHQWVEHGGNLLTLYHRPWDDWDENTIPPRRLLIGKPSLRWRVTDEQAEVLHLLPDHPLLNSPNVITESDWLNWHKERGLYFAADWDDTYEALLSMADPDEKPLIGSLLSAQIGSGRHTHTSLILHHQMEQLVPGAYRLMANLVAGVR